MITATFSNGATDTYKGRRDVKAAWAIFDKDNGELLMSGHSLDRGRAQKTAESNWREASYKAGVTVVTFDVPSRLYAGANYSYLYQRAAKHGYTGRPVMGAYKTWAKAQNTATKSAAMERLRVEIVDL